MEEHNATWWNLLSDPPRNLRQEAACLLSIVLHSGSHLHVGTSASPISTSLCSNLPFASKVDWGSLHALSMCLVCLPLAFVDLYIVFPSTRKRWGFFLHGCWRCRAMFLTLSLSIRFLSEFPPFTRNWTCDISWQLQRLYPWGPLHHRLHARSGLVHGLCPSPEPKWPDTNHLLYLLETIVWWKNIRNMSKHLKWGASIQ